MAVADARAITGAELLVGLSTHAPAEIDAADADYIGVGPVHATPTKPGRLAVGLDLVRYAAEHAELPWFAIGGVDPASVDAVVEAGATRIAVVRAITDAEDPEAAASALRASLPQEGEGFAFAGRSVAARQTREVTHGRP
jgi:thiamine-phosphate pyrophosphorylase